MRHQLSTLALLCHAAATGATSVLLSNASAIITFDTKTEALSVLRHGSVLVDGDRIAGLYDSAEPNSLPRLAPRIIVRVRSTSELGHVATVTFERLSFCVGVLDSLRHSNPGKHQAALIQPLRSQLTFSSNHYGSQSHIQRTRNSRHSNKSYTFCR